MPAPGAQHQSVTNPFEDRVQRISQYTAEEIASLQQILERKLGPEYISARPGPSGSPVHYISAEKVISLANDVFGFNGWSSSIQNIQVDYADENAQTNRITLGISVVVRVTLRDGTYHEDIGYGKIENAKGKGAAFEKAKKEATTDAMKRALRHFGNVLGNCIYDKDYVKKVTRVKIGPGRTWDVGDLHRHPDFKDEIKDQVIPKPAATTMQTVGALVNVTAPDVTPAVASTVASTLASTVAPAAGPPAEARKETSGMPDMTDDVTDAFFDDEYGGAFDPSDFAPEEDGHPDEVSISTWATEKSAPGQAQQARPPFNNTNTRPNQPPAPARNPQTPVQNQSYSRPPPPQGNPPPFNKPVTTTTNVSSGPTTNNTAGRTNPNTRMNGPANGAPTAPSSDGATRAGFFSARAVSVNANDVNISNPGQTFDPKAESPSIRKTAGIDHTSSKPIARNGIHVPPSSDQGGGSSNPIRPPPANVPAVNALNPHIRRIGAPGAPLSPLANRGQYKPPSMKRPLDGPGGASDDAGRTALAEVSTNGPGGGGAQGLQGGGVADTKRQKVV